MIFCLPTDDLFIEAKQPTNLDDNIDSKRGKFFFLPSWTKDYVKLLFRTDLSFSYLNFFLLYINFYSSRGTFALWIGPASLVFVFSPRFSLKAVMHSGAESSHKITQLVK